VLRGQVLFWVSRSGAESLRNLERAALENVSEIPCGGAGESKIIGV